MKAQVPLVVFNGKLDMTEYEYNLDLTRNLALERV